MFSVLVYYSQWQIQNAVKHALQMSHLPFPIAVHILAFTLLRRCFGTNLYILAKEELIIRYKPCQHLWRD